MVFGSRVQIRTRATREEMGDEDQVVMAQFSTGHNEFWACFLPPAHPSFPAVTVKDLFDIEAYGGYIEGYAIKGSSDDALSEAGDGEAEIIAAQRPNEHDWPGEFYVVKISHHFDESEKPWETLCVNRNQALNSLFYRWSAWLTDRQP